MGEIWVYGGVWAVLVIAQFETRKQSFCFIEGSQYSEPLGKVYAPISEYKEKYRGLATFWKFDRALGRIDADNSFAVELPPYWQDLADSSTPIGY